MLALGQKQSAVPKNAMLCQYPFSRSAAAGATAGAAGAAAAAAAAPAAVNSVPRAAYLCDHGVTRVAHVPRVSKAVVWNYEGPQADTRRSLSSAGVSVMLGIVTGAPIAAQPSSRGARRSQLREHRS